VIAKVNTRSGEVQPRAEGAQVSRR
jgi:hypothetical protein